MNNQPPDSASVAPSTAGMPLETASRKLAARFRNAGLQTPELDARLLVCHTCNITYEQLVGDAERILAHAEAEKLEAKAQRRLAREPVSRIIGYREFHGLKFMLGPQTLDPRADTETLVEAALEVAHNKLAGREISILDLGTGSGCILLSLLHALPGARGVGVDISEEALKVARANAAALEISERSQFTCSDWTKNISGAFSLVVSNPPYISSNEIDALEPEVSKFDPRRSLDGGEDGLDPFRRIFLELGSVLLPGGWVLLELGATQAISVTEILKTPHEKLNFDEFREWQDLSGHIRSVGAKRSPR